MLRSSEEIINEYWEHPMDLLKDVPKMINEARKEAIKEAAQKAMDASRGYYIDDIQLYVYELLNQIK